MGLKIENYMIMEKVYISMMETVDSEFVTKHAKWGDDKSIYDSNDKNPPPKICWWAKIYEVVNCLVKLGRNYFEVGLVWVSHVTQIKFVFQRK